MSEKLAERINKYLRALPPHVRNREAATLLSEAAEALEKEESRPDYGNDLAYAVAKAIQRGSVGLRSKIGDALLDYLNVGSIGGPTSFPEWMAEYEAENQ